MCVILQKLSLPLAPPARTFALSFNPPLPPSLCHCFQLFTFPFFHSYGLLEQSFGNAVQIRLWCQNRASLLHTFGLLVSPGAKVTRGPAGQLVPIASRGLFFSGGRLVSLAAQMWGEQGISPQETSKLWPTGETDGGPKSIQRPLIHFKHKHKYNDTHVARKMWAWHKFSSETSTNRPEK